MTKIHSTETPGDKEAELMDYDILAATANVVDELIRTGSVSLDQLPATIAAIGSAFANVVTDVIGGRPDKSARESAVVVPAAVAAPEVERTEGEKPAVDPKLSVFRDHLICLDCGGEFHTLKRHVKGHGYETPEHYKKRWGLPPDYPMVCPTYSEERSEMAKRMGLGTRENKARAHKTPLAAIVAGRRRAG